MIVCAEVGGLVEDTTEGTAAADDLSSDFVWHAEPILVLLMWLCR